MWINISWETQSLFYHLPLHSNHWHHPEGHEHVELTQPTALLVRVLREVIENGKDPLPSHCSLNNDSLVALSSIFLPSLPQFLICKRGIAMRFCSKIHLKHLALCLDNVRDHFHLPISSHTLDLMATQKVSGFEILKSNI